MKRAGEICYIAHNYRLLNDEPKQQKVLEHGMDVADVEEDDGDDDVEEEINDEMFHHENEDFDDEFNQLLIENEFD